MDQGLDCWLLSLSLLLGWVGFYYVVYVLFEDGSDYEWDACECEIVQGDVPVVKDCLC